MAIANGICKQTNKTHDTHWFIVTHCFRDNLSRSWWVISPGESDCITAFRRLSAVQQSQFPIHLVIRSIKFVFDFQSLQIRLICLSLKFKQFHLQFDGRFESFFLRFPLVFYWRFLNFSIGSQRSCWWNYSTGHQRLGLFAPTQSLSFY